MSAVSTPHRIWNLTYGSRGAPIPLATPSGDSMPMDDFLGLDSLTRLFGNSTLSLESIVSKLDGWTIPGDATSERTCEKALETYLHKLFPKEIFQRQYKQGNTSSDLRVKVDASRLQIAIELKYQLTSRAEYHRLIGQLWTYVSEWEHEAILVLCGDCDTTLVRQAERFAKFLSEHTRKVRVVTKAILREGIQTK
jgi:hypothetical protein